MSEYITPTIVIIAYNREDALSRLLKSIQAACYPNDVEIDLIICIDGGGKDEVNRIAENFHWDKGKKEVILNKSNLGLRNHVISCGDLLNKYESIIMLEEDCFVSYNFYNYSLDALNFYKEEEKIAGISLYSYRFNENALLPFAPLNDDNNVYFMQVPSSWGQAWTRKQWNKFKHFYNHTPSINEKDLLPQNVKNWPDSSWKKYFYKYIVDENLFIVYPTVSQTTNFGDVGTHFQSKTNTFQVNLDTKRNASRYSFIEFKKSWNKYDAYFEIFPEYLENYGIKDIPDLGMDLFGTKQLVLFEYKFVYSIKECKIPIQSFGMELKPLLNNIINNISGNVIHFGRKDDFTFVNEKIKNSILSYTDPIVFQHAFNSGLANGITEGRTTGIKFIKNSIVYRAGYFILYPLIFLKEIIIKFKRNNN